MPTTMIYVFFSYIYIFMGEITINPLVIRLIFTLSIRDLKLNTLPT